MLGYARIITIVMICFVYANHVSRETAYLQFFVGTALFYLYCESYFASKSEWR